MEVALYDLLLTADGDLNISAGDLRITDSIKQAIDVRLGWFLNEWKFAPQYGVPYYEYVLVKNPRKAIIMTCLRAEIMKVAGVTAQTNCRTCKT